MASRYGDRTRVTEAVSGLGQRGGATEKLNISVTPGPAHTVDTPGNGYTYYRILSSATLTVNAGEGAADVTLIGGGGGGGSAIPRAPDSNYGGGGGGGGGQVYTAKTYLSPGPYPVVVGAGGAVDTRGSFSTFNNLTGYGGGCGQSTIFLFSPNGNRWGMDPEYGPVHIQIAGFNSGGQPGFYSPAIPGPQSNFTVFPSGFAGGTSSGANQQGGGSGGGGAGGAGSASTVGPWPSPNQGTGPGGNGGIGATSPIAPPAYPATYGGGGGGGTTSTPGNRPTSVGTTGIGGPGGGGNGGYLYNPGANQVPATAGSANSGGGGGGAGKENLIPGYSLFPAAAGGSGIVIIRVVA